MNKIPYIVIVVLVVVIILMRSCGNVDSKETTYVKTDTIYKETKDTITKDVKVFSVKYVPVKEYIFKSIDTCNKEYNRQTVYRDTIKLDSIGDIKIIDTVFQNRLGKRTIFKDYKIPLVTKTVTIIEAQQPNRQLYIGGNLFGDRRSLHMITPGLFYKDRKDRVYQLSVGVNFDGTLTYGLGTYWKINLKK
jgi:hypothetical protein